MNIDLARHMVRVGFHCGRELEGLMHTLKTRLGEEEYKPLALAIATAVHEIQNATLEPAFAAHPGLEAEVEAEVRKHGSYVGGANT